MSERIKSTKLFLLRKQRRVEEARPLKAREVLAEPIAAQEKEETLWADKERRLAELVLEEKAAPSPSTVPPQSVGPDVSAELSRMQAIIDNLQGEFPRLRGRAPGPHCRRQRVNGVTSLSQEVQSGPNHVWPRQAAHREHHRQSRADTHGVPAAACLRFEAR